MPDGVQIDAGKVGDVGRGLRHEADAGFAATAQRGTSLHGHGVEFGARLTPSGVVTEAKNRYAQALAHTEANLRAYQVAAGVLADAAEEISRLFAASDLSAEEAQRKVQDLIDNAVRAADAAVGDQ
jgi:hypothetical protein